MIVICAGTTGDHARLDRRRPCMRQKRLQRWHFADDDQARGANDLVNAPTSGLRSLDNARAEPAR
jgi:hypothetical protein